MMYVVGGFDFVFGYVLDWLCDEFDMVVVYCGEIVV